MTPTDPALIAWVEGIARDMLHFADGKSRAADLHALLRRIRELEAELDAARKALARLGSMEAIAIAGMAGPELIARVDYARAALASAPAEPTP